MNTQKHVIVAGAAIAISGSLCGAASAARDACTVLPPEVFSKIVGHEVKKDIHASGRALCTYIIGSKFGGYFMVLEGVLPPGPQPKYPEGSAGGRYSQGNVVFSFTINSTDKTKLPALVAEVRSKLKN